MNLLPTGFYPTSVETHDCNAHPSAVAVTAQPPSAAHSWVRTYWYARGQLLSRTMGKANAKVSTFGIVPGRAQHKQSELEKQAKLPSSSSCRLHVFPFLIAI